MALHGWVIYNGFLPSDTFRDFALMLQEAAHDRNHHLTLKTNDEVINNFTDQYVSEKPDYVLFTDKDIYLANMLERAGIPLFNSARSIEISDDKIKTYERLLLEDIPIPKTIVAPKTFGFDISPQHPLVQQVVKEFGYPFIMKEAYGSFGEQVYLVHNEEELPGYLEVIDGAPFVFQQFIASSSGVDLRLQVVGDEVVAAMKRSSQHDFRANITSGGKMVPYEANDYEKEIAILSTKAIGAHFAGVDLLFGEDAKRYVCEVNSNGHIRNLLDCTGINVAPYIIEHIERVLQG